MLDIEKANNPAVAKALRDLENRSGQLTPEKVFRAAKDSKSVLHQFFQWDKSQAWHSYNIERARKLLASVTYKVHTEDHGTIRVPAYVRDPRIEPAKQGYMSMRELIAPSKLAHDVVINECDQAAGHLRRALAVALTLGYADVLQQIIGSILAFKDTVQRKKAA